MSDSPALWLWFDVESSGLLDSRPVVLECAWMVTDDELRQLTPLRQRLTAIPCAPVWWERVVSWLRPDQLREWPSLLMPGPVQEMHYESGLEFDWKRGEKIRDVRVVDELVMADLADATVALDSDQKTATHLAGAGVAQFEARLLPMIGSGLPPWLHYRCADSSVTAMTLGVPKTTEAPPGDHLSVDIQDGVDVQRATTAPHRAAADVRAAWHQVREIRAGLSFLAT